MTLELHSWLTSTLLATTLFAVAHQLARVRPLPRPTLGIRGVARARWLERSMVGATFEPWLRFCGALVARLPFGRARSRLDRLVERAGHTLGLCADECLALCLLLSCAAAWVAAAIGLGFTWTVLCGALGAAAPLADLHERARRRQREIGRRLPDAIDLMALCMGAGLDFTAALDRVTRELAATSGALGDELHRVQQELSLGRARARVLAELAERVPAPAVSDFARAVIQAAQRGTPLCDVLDIQARMTRMRRSVAAEEAAARASVLLLLPLLLLLGAIMLVLFGPFAIEGMGWR
jgi:tight adherence protein C